jgi:hypothetical protein
MSYSTGETAEDAERWWQAYQLAEHDQAEELRERTEAGDEYARAQLAGLLSDRGRNEEAIEVIRPLADGGDKGPSCGWPAGWLTVITSMSCAHEPPPEATPPCTRWLYGWLTTSICRHCAHSLTTTASSWPGGWPWERIP